MRKITLALIAILTLSGCAATIEPVIKVTHMSDITRTPPEPTNDYVGAGVTVGWRNLEIDITHGRRARDCTRMSGCPWESGTELSMRVYPFRRDH